MKSGTQTTEFWLSIAGLIFTAVAPLLPHSTEVVNAVSAVAAALVAFGYTWARTFAKTKSS
jgi:hypothetical protein